MKIVLAQSAGWLPDGVTHTMLHNDCNWYELWTLLQQKCKLSMNELFYIIHVHIFYILICWNIIFVCVNVFFYANHEKIYNKIKLLLIPLLHPQYCCTNRITDPLKKYVIYSSLYVSYFDIFCISLESEILHDSWRPTEFLLARTWPHKEEWRS